MSKELEDRLKVLNEFEKYEGNLEHLSSSNILNVFNELENNLKCIENAYKDRILSLIKKALTPPTEEEVCEHLNESFGLKGKNTTLHFIYDKESKEFRMVDEKNYVYRYISTKRVNEDAIELIDLDIDDIIILGRFYESLEGEK